MTRRLRTDLHLFAYTIVMLLGSPFFLALKIRKFLKHGNFYEVDPKRWYSRETREQLEKKNYGASGQHFVFLGASFGEILIMERFTAELLAKDPNARVTWAIRDHNTIEHVRVTRPNQEVVPWPFDFFIPVNRFLKLVKPDVLVFTERFRFLSLACGASVANTRLVLINGRAKEIKSRLHWVHKTYQRWTCELFDLMLVQTERDAELARAMANRSTKVIATGDIKTDVRLTTSAHGFADLESWFAPMRDLPIVALGSSDNAQEEALVLEAFKIVRAKVPCRLLLAPRRTDRSPSIEEFVEGEGFSCSRRSVKGPVADVLILDSIGELANAYRFASASYVGGFLFGQGHNIMEPLVWGVPVAYGPRKGHFGAIQARCEEFQVGFRVQDAEELAAHWLKVLQDAAFRAEIAKRCADLIADRAGVFELAFQELLNSTRQPAAPIEPKRSLSVAGRH